MYDSFIVKVYFFGTVLGIYNRFLRRISMDEKSKAIDIIRSDIADKQEQIKFIEELDVTRLVT